MRFVERGRATLISLSETVGASRTTKVLVVWATMLAVLTPAWIAPAKMVSTPVTIARSISGGGSGGRTLAFRPTHIAFSWRGTEGSRLRYRILQTTADPSHWRMVPESHDMATGNRHFSAVIAVDRPQAIRWAAASQSAVEEVTIDYLDTVGGPRQLVTMPAAAQAEARTPDIVTRAEWGADESVKRTTGRCRRRFFPVQQLFVHHTAGVNADPHPAATMRAIYWFHTVRRGWCDIGYNFVISPDGRVFEGRWARTYRPWETPDAENLSGDVVMGAHVADHNGGSVGISMMGNYSNARAPDPMRTSLVRMLAWEADRHNLSPRAHHVYRSPVSSLAERLPVLAGHRDGGYTECPGNFLYGALPGIRRAVALVIGQGKPNSKLALGSDSARIDFGSTSLFSGRLRTATGAALTGRPVFVFRRQGRGAFKRINSVSTGAEGRFSIRVSPPRTATFVAVFEGGRSAWGSESDKVKLAVAPLVTLAPEGATPDPNGVYHYPPGTASVRLTGAVEPARAASSASVEIVEKLPDGGFAPAAVASVGVGQGGGYTYDFEVPDPAAGGLFRATGLVGKSEIRAAGFSDPVWFQIDPQP